MPNYSSTIFPFIEHYDIALLTVGRTTGLDFFCVYVYVWGKVKKVPILHRIDLLYELNVCRIRCLYSIAASIYLYGL